VNNSGTILATGRVVDLRFTGVPRHPSLIGHIRCRRLLPSETLQGVHRDQCESGTISGGFAILPTDDTTVAMLADRGDERAPRCHQPGNSANVTTCATAPFRTIAISDGINGIGSTIPLPAPSSAPPCTDGIKLSAAPTADAAERSRTSACDMVTSRNRQRHRECRDRRAEQQGVVAHDAAGCHLHQLQWRHQLHLLRRRFNGPRRMQAGNQIPPSIHRLAQTDRTLLISRRGVVAGAGGSRRGRRRRCCHAISYAPRRQGHVMADRLQKFPASFRLAEPGDRSRVCQQFWRPAHQDASNDTLRRPEAFGAPSHRPQGAAGWLVAPSSAGGRVVGRLELQKVDTDTCLPRLQPFEWPRISSFYPAGRQRRPIIRPAGAHKPRLRGMERANASYNAGSSAGGAYGFRQNRPTVCADAGPRGALCAGSSTATLNRSAQLADRQPHAADSRSPNSTSPVTTFFGGGHTLKTNLHGGVTRWQRAGTPPSTPC